MAAVLIDNPFVKDYPPFASVIHGKCDAYDTTAAGGTFRVVTIPGPVLLMGSSDRQSVGDSSMIEV